MRTSPKMWWSWQVQLGLTRSLILLAAQLTLMVFSLLTHQSLLAAAEDRAFNRSTLSFTWSESTDNLSAQIATLNEEYAASKGSKGSRLATYSIRNANQSLFELYDRDGRYTTPQEKRDYSHQLEIRLKPAATIDYEALPSSKSITLVIDANAKGESDIRRLVHSSEVDEALAALHLLGTPSALTTTIKVTDVDERPVVAASYEPSNNYRRGFLVRMKTTDSRLRFNASRLFVDPEGKPIYLKPNAEDVAIREFPSLSPNFGTNTVTIGDTDVDNNSLAGNSPSEDGRIVRVSTEGSTITVVPVKEGPLGIRKAEIWIRGWDQRGPTLANPRVDPATAFSLAKITVLVQNGTNEPPRWRGNASGFGVVIKEGYTGPLLPPSNNSNDWGAIDSDGDQVTYSLRNASTSGACAKPIAKAGISFGEACISLENSNYVNLSISGIVDYETVKADPVARFTLLATDTFGHVAEATFLVTVQDVDEPISGGFKNKALSIYLPKRSIREIDLTQVFYDPEERDVLTFRATSTNSDVVSVNRTPTPLLVLTAHKIGQSTVHAWASTKTSSHHSAMTVYVRDTNAAPTFPEGVESYQLTIREDAPVGTKIPTIISASDSDLGDVLSFSIDNNPSFGLSDEGLASNSIQLVTKSRLDFETQERYTFTLRVSDDAASDDVLVHILLSNIDESVQATPTVIAPVYVSTNALQVIDALEHFVDEDGQVPIIDARAHDASIVDVFVRSDGEIHIFGKKRGTTTITMTASDSSGGVAAKRFTVIVDQSEAPVVNQPVADQTMQPGLLEVSIKDLFKDPDSDYTIASVSSSDEDVVWVLQPQNEPDTLVLYAWMIGTAEISVVARDPSANETTYTFTVTVAVSEPPDVSALIPNQKLQVGERLGALSLLEAFSTADEQPNAFTLESSNTSKVSVMLGSRDVVAWWHALSCSEKVIAVGDTGDAEDSNPYCVDFASLTVQRKVIVRSVAAHHALLHGISAGQAQITATATYETGAMNSTTFTTTVEAATTTVAASMPQRVTYPNTTLELNVKDLIDINSGIQAFGTAVRHTDIAQATLSEDAQTLRIQGLSIGSTDIALLGLDATGARVSVKFSLQVANRAPQVLSDGLVLALELGEEPRTQDLLDVFSDDEMLTFALGTFDHTIVIASLDGSQLIVEPLRKGATQLPVTATDTYGVSVASHVDITIDDQQLQQVAAASLAGYGRAVLNSVSSVIGSRLNRPLENAADLPSRQPQLDPAALDSLSLTNHTAFDSWSDAPVGSADQSLPSNMNSVGPAFPRMTQSYASSDADRSWTIWTDADTQTYQGDGQQGRVRSHFVGADLVMSGRFQAGVAGSRVHGSGGYAFGTAARTFEIQQLILSPYARFERNANDSIWAIASVGTGHLKTTASEHDGYEHDLRTSALLVGATRRLANTGRFDLAWQADAAHMTVSAETDTPNVADLTADVQRVRGGVAASVELPLLEFGSLEPFTEVNLRYDTGTDHTGGGVELVGGTRLELGAISMELRGRSFVLNDGTEYSEQGVALSTTFNPSNDPSGWSISLAPTWGHAEPTFNAFETRGSMSPRPNAWLRDDAEHPTFSMNSTWSYGFLVNQERFVLTPYVQAQMNAGNEHRVGMRLQGTTRSTRALELDFSAHRDAFSQHESDTGVLLSLTLRR